MRNTSGLILAFDLGGTKLAAALVDGDTIIERRRVSTRRDAGADGWVDDMAILAQAWRGRFDRVGVAVTGGVHAGRWHSLNRLTLAIDDGYPIVQALQVRVGLPVLAVNDAQAAAWGEYLFGAGRGRDLVFLTVSTGVGGGVVADGRLLRGRGGLAGHVGQIPLGREPFENGAGGRSIEAAAERLGHRVDAREVFAAAATGADWAEALINTSARRVAALCDALQAVLDPHVIVLGGGVGLADGYRQRVERALAPGVEVLRPALLPAELGADAGLLGVANLADLARDRAPAAGTLPPDPATPR